jgi:hypothetical protein
VTQRQWFAVEHLFHLFAILGVTLAVGSSSVLPRFAAGKCFALAGPLACDSSEIFIATF